MAPTTTAESYRRAVSPAAMAALTIADIPVSADAEATASATTEARNAARSRLYYAADSFDGLVDLIPGDFRVPLREPLKAIQSSAERLIAARNLIAKWEKLRLQGKRPDPWNAKQPVIQFSKDYAESADASAARTALAAKHEEYLSSAFADALAAQQGQVDSIHADLQPMALLRRLKPAYLRVLDINSMRYRRPNLVSTLVDGKVEHTLEGWFEDPEWTRLRGEVLSDLPILGLRVVTIAETASLVETLKTEKKKALQRDIDVEMADANQPDFRNIAEMVAEAVKKE
ncbi:hypothetical protein H0H81_008710, partial [Sphagnurus paluster]